MRTLLKCSQISTRFGACSLCFCHRISRNSAVKILRHILASNKVICAAISPDLHSSNGNALSWFVITCEFKRWYQRSGTGRTFDQPLLEVIFQQYHEVVATVYIARESKVSWLMVIDVIDGDVRVSNNN